jgi:hypothetical protein
MKTVPADLRKLEPAVTSGSTPAGTSADEKGV